MATEQSTKKIYVVYTNTDLTEGRGMEYPLYYCELESTAIRLAQQKYVQGTNAPIYEKEAICIGSKWYLPAALVHIQKPTRDDSAAQGKIDAMKAAVARAKAAGLTDNDIALLKG